MAFPYGGLLSKTHKIVDEATTFAQYFFVRTTITEVTELHDDRTNVRRMSNFKSTKFGLYFLENWMS